MQFAGTFEHTVDAKGRVSLPAKIRKMLPDTLIVARPFSMKTGNFLQIFTEEGYAEYIDSFFPAEEGRKYNPRKRTDVLLRRHLSASSELTSVDSAGRIKLPLDMCKEAGIKKDVVIVGDVDHVEIWDVDAWADTSAESIDLLESLMED